jgi:hypothetical protein
MDNPEEEARNKIKVISLFAVVAMAIILYFVREYATEIMGWVQTLI